VELVTLDPSKVQARDRKKEDPLKKKQAAVKSSEMKGTSPQADMKEDKTPGMKPVTEVSASSATKGPVAPSQEVSSSGKSGASKSFNIVRSSKFRHIEGSLKDKTTFITKFPSLSSTVPGDSNAFQVTFTGFCFPLI